MALARQRRKAAPDASRLLVEHGECKGGVAFSVRARAGTPLA
jgi:hypothetical protein